MTVSNRTGKSKGATIEVPATEVPVTEVRATRDTFLGDGLTMAQPASGYRAGIDAVLLAASVAMPAGAGFQILDVGAGAGTVGLCVAARLPLARVVLFEREPVLAGMAAANIAANNFSDRAVALEGDVAISSENLTKLGLQQESFDWVVANPPFHDTDNGTLAGDSLKAVSHAMPGDALELWARFMARMARASGRMALIHKAEALPRILSALEGRFGALTVLPIQPREGEPAIRVLVQGTKGSRAPMTLKPALILHGAGQGFTPLVEAVVRQGKALPGL